MVEAETHPLLVEFIGASGAGKTFLATKVISILADRGLPVTNFKHIEIKCTASNMLRAMRAAIIALRIKPKTLRGYVDTVFRLALHGIHYDVCRGIDRINVSDDGIFHKMRSMYRNSRLSSMEEVSDRIFSYVAVPDMIVVIEAGAEEIYARRSKRKRGNEAPTLRSIQDDISLLEKSIKTIKHVQRSTPGSLTMVRVCSMENEMEDSAERLATLAEGVFKNTFAYQECIDLRSSSTHGTATRTDHCA